MHVGRITIVAFVHPSICVEHEHTPCINVLSVVNDEQQIEPVLAALDTLPEWSLPAGTESSESAEDAARLDLLADAG